MKIWDVTKCCKSFTFRHTWFVTCVFWHYQYKIVYKEYYLNVTAIKKIFLKSIWNMVLRYNFNILMFIWTQQKHLSILPLYYYWDTMVIKPLGLQYKALIPQRAIMKLSHTLLDIFLGSQCLEFCLVSVTLLFFTLKNVLVFLLNQ